MHILPIQHTCLCVYFESISGFFSETDVYDTSLIAVVY